MIILISVGSNSLSILTITPDVLSTFVRELILSETNTPRTHHCSMLLLDRHWVRFSHVQKKFDFMERIQVNGGFGYNSKTFTDMPLIYCLAFCKPLPSFLNTSCTSMCIHEIIFCINRWKKNTTRIINTLIILPHYYEKQVSCLIDKLGNWGH